MNVTCCRDDPVAEKPATKMNDGSKSVILHEEPRECSCTHCLDLPIEDIARCCQVTGGPGSFVLSSQLAV